MEQGKKLALVTGGNRGIGLAIVEGLSANGYRVLLASRKLESGRDAAASIEGDVIAVQLDVTDQESVDALKRHIERDYGRLDVLINNAGIALDHWVSGLEVDINVVRETFETNILGVLRCCLAFVPMMQAAGSGRVVNVSSELGSLEPMSMAGSLAYRTSKTALNAVTKLLALDVKDTANLKINAACPGWVKTELGGPDAPRSTEEGADTIIWLATLGDDGPSGGNFRDREPYPW